MHTKQLFMKKNIYRLPGIWLLLLLAGFFISSCDHSYLDMDEIPDYTYSPEFAVPMVKSSLSIEDIVPDEDIDLIEVDEDNFISLVYRKSAETLRGDELFTLPDQDSQVVFEVSSDGKSGQATFTETLDFSFGAGERLDSISMEAGNLLVTASAADLASDGYNAVIAVTIPHSYDESGNPLSFEFDLNNPGSASLDGYTFVFYSNADQHNLFDLEYQVTLTGNGTPDNAPYDLTINKSFFDLEFSSIFGDVSYTELALGEGEIPISIFRNWVDGTIEFVDPFVKIDALNSFGFPVSVNTYELYGQADEETLDLTGYPNPWEIQSPGMEQLGETVKTSLLLDSASSNIKELIALPPKEFFYNMDAGLNPDGKQTGFVNNNSRLTVELEVWLPLHGSVENYRIEDTLDFSLGETIDELEWIEFNFGIVNGFPLDTYFQVFFLDENDIVLTQMFEESDERNIIQSAELDDNGMVISATEKNTKVFLDQDKLDDMIGSEKLMISARLQTTEEGEIPVKIFSDQYLDLSIGVKAKGKVVVEF